MDHLFTLYYWILKAKIQFCFEHQSQTFPRPLTIVNTYICTHRESKYTAQQVSRAGKLLSWLCGAPLGQPWGQQRPCPGWEPAPEFPLPSCVASALWSLPKATLQGHQQHEGVKQRKAQHMTTPWWQLPGKGNAPWTLSPEGPTASQTRQASRPNIGSTRRSANEERVSQDFPWFSEWTTYLTIPMQHEGKYNRKTTQKKKSEFLF